MNERDVRFLDRYFKSVPKGIPNGGSMILIDREVDYETDKAILVCIRGEKKWLPKSQCYATNGKLAVPRWLVRTDEETEAEQQKIKIKKLNQRQKRLAIKASSDMSKLNRHLMNLANENLALRCERMGLDFGDEWEDEE